MTIASAPQVNLKLNFNDHEYEFQDLPQPAQHLLKDIARLDQQISQLQFELRHLQAARELFGRSLQATMTKESQGSEAGEGNGFHHEGEGHGDAYEN